MEEPVTFCVGTNRCIQFDGYVGAVLACGNDGSANPSIAIDA